MLLQSDCLLTSTKSGCCSHFYCHSLFNQAEWYSVACHSSAYTWSLTDHLLCNVGLEKPAACLRSKPKKAPDVGFLSFAQVGNRLIPALKIGTFAPNQMLHCVVQGMWIPSKIHQTNVIMCSCSSAWAQGLSVTAYLNKIWMLFTFLLSLTVGNRREVKHCLPPNSSDLFLERPRAV